jgi:hypothetical protein
LSIISENGAPIFGQMDAGVKFPKRRLPAQALLGAAVAFLISA